MTAQYTFEIPYKTRAMSYITEIENSIAEVSIAAEGQLALGRESLASEEMVEAPSAKELFSYGVCCAAQWLMWAMCLVLVIVVPAAIGQGIF
jgi:hypothetical protein